MDKVKKIFKSNWCLFPLGIIIIFVLHLITNETSYVYDSKTYMKLGLSFGLDEFSFANYNNAYRGYLLPFCHWILYKMEALGIGNISLNLYLFHSILFSFSLTIIIPNLMEYLFKIKLSLFSRCAFLVISIMMFKGSLIYPASDIPAFSCMCGALYLFLLIKNEKITKTPLKIAASFGVGFLLSAAYFIRPIYLISIIAYLVYAIVKLIYNAFKKKTYYGILFMIVFPVIGILIVALPQIYINYYNFNVISPMILTGEKFEGSLYLQQLKWGLEIQKYETNLDIDSYASAPVRFYDGIGQAILADSEIHSYWDYIVFVFTHFFDVLFIYLRHIFNGMDITYPNLYIKNIYNNRMIIQLINYSLLYLGIIGLKKNIKKSSWSFDLAGMLMIYIMPVILCIPTGVETRFFLGAQILMFTMACKAVTDIDWKQEILQNKKVLLKYILFLTVCFMFNSYLFGTIGIPFNK